ncbi:MAG: hypothetical protein FWF44_01115 [Defluviitaleaceae bacterium]|nr:hypothetical protein [Defluviitaleaceae bacterium]
MTDRFTDMLRRKLAVGWGQDKGPLDLRNHSAGIGGVQSAPAPQAVVEATAALKPRLIRIFLQEFFFIYPDHGVFDWQKMDAYMDAVHAMGGDIMASICVKPRVLYPEIDEKIWMPNDTAEWQEVVTALVLRYSKEKPYVTHWVVANEMNIGEYGGCPYLITDPDDFFEYYKLTAEPIRKALPGVKVGGPSYAGVWGGAEYLGRFAELCARDHVALDFTCYNMYSDDPSEHAAGARQIRDAVAKYLPETKLYMTEFNIGISEEYSLEEKAYDPKRAAAQAASILLLHEDGALEGSFQYHIYDQWCDPREFAPWYARARYMANHWNDQVHRCGLLDLDGKARPEYFVYKMLYSMTGRRVCLGGTDNILRGISSRGEDGALSLFLVNYAEKGTPDAVAQISFTDAPEGVYRMNVTRIDRESAALMKAAPVCSLPPAESRVVYAHPDFHFDVYIPADAVTFVRFIPE